MSEAGIDRPMTPQERVQDIWEAIEQSKSYAEGKLLLTEAITQAEQRGRSAGAAEMRERCATTLEDYCQFLEKQLAVVPDNASIRDRHTCVESLKNNMRVLPLTALGSEPSDQSPPK